MDSLMTQEGSIVGEKNAGAEASPVAFVDDVSSISAVVGIAREVFAERTESVWREAPGPRFKDG